MILGYVGLWFGFGVRVEGLGSKFGMKRVGKVELRTWFLVVGSWGIRVWG